jgi:hypothetical protein
MEQMQRSFTQMQELAGKLQPTKQAAKNNKVKSAEPQHGKRKQSRQDIGDSKIHIDFSSLANPPPPPLYPVRDLSSSRKVQGTTRRATKGKFNGSIKITKMGRSGNENLVESS